MAFENVPEVGRVARAARVEPDMTIVGLCGWDDLDLAHGFHETNQCLRFTISEAARREVLDRLLELNHQRYTQELQLDAGGSGE